MEIDRFIISDTASVKEALVALNNQHSSSLTLFVVNSDHQILGSVTDGDIRRGIISGLELEDPITSCMNKNFSSLKKGPQDVLAIRELKRNAVKLVPVVDNQGHLIEIYNLQTLKSILPIDAVIMAGGKGERLRPLTENTPKPLIKVGDKCIIDYNVDRLIEYGVKHINVTVNYLKEQLHEHYASPRHGIQIDTVEEPKFLGTIGSIQYVKEFYNDTVLLMNSDLFTNIDFEDFYLHFKEHDAMMSVAAIPYNVSIPFGILDLDGREIKGLLEKPKYNYYANGGIYLMKREALDYIPKEEFFNATDLIEKLVANNKKVIRYPLNGTWIDIGNKDEYLKAQDIVKHINF